MSYQREFEKRIPVAVIGAGSHSIRNLLPVMNYLPVRLAAVCDIDARTARLSATQYGCDFYASTEALYKSGLDIQAVFICVGPKLHPVLVKEALDAGCHVWVEKPLAVRAKHVEELIQVRGSRVVVVGLKKAFMPAAVKAKEIVASAKYGGLQSILAVYHMSLPQDGHRVLEEEQITNWLGNGVHPLAFLSEIGGRVDEVLAYTNSEGFGAVMLKFANGIMGTLHLSSGPPPDVERYDLFAKTWEMSITNHQIELRRGLPSFKYGRTTTFAPEGEDSGILTWRAENCVATLENKALFTQGIYNECRHFCDCILEEKSPETGSLEQALEVMKIYEAALVSKGKPVKLR